MQKEFSWQDWLIVVPARLQSSRLPEKPLQDLKGQPLIVRVYQRLSTLADKGAQIVVGTDSEKVLSACQQREIPACLTDPQHASGTDRVHEVASKYPHKFILNVQGDEPFVNLSDLENLCLSFQSRPNPEMGTLVHLNSNRADFENPNCVKVVRRGDFALYFSRSPIPYPRDGVFQGFWQHIGIYAFSRTSLNQFCKLPMSSLEAIEKLEQLRALENSMQVHLCNANKPGLGIDTPEDLEEARARY